MATYRFNATITILGVRDKQAAIDALQIALDDYEDMNPGCAEIIIQHDEPKRVKFD